MSRMTARRAVDELEQEGYINRVQGAGSFPTGHRFRQGVFRIRPLEEIAGSEATFTTVLSAGLAVADEPERLALNLGPGSAVLSIVRLRGANDQPIMLERRALMAGRAEALIGHNLGGESIHDLLVEVTGIEISRVEQSLDAVNAPPEEARILCVNAGSAVFLLRRTSFANDEPISFARYWVRPDCRPFTSAFAP